MLPSWQVWILYPDWSVVAVTFTSWFVQSVVDGVNFKADVLPFVSIVGTTDVLNVATLLSVSFPAISFTIVFTWYSVFAVNPVYVWVSAASVVHCQSVSDFFFIAYFFVDAFNPDWAFTSVAAGSVWLNVIFTVVDAGTPKVYVGASFVGANLSILEIVICATSEWFAPS